MAAVRQVLVVSAVVWVFTSVTAGVWALVAGGTPGGRFGMAAIAVGALVCMTGGNLWSRREVQPARPWTSAWERGGIEDQGYGRLTGLGISLFVGAPLVIAGSLLL